MLVLFGFGCATTGTNHVSRGEQLLASSEKVVNSSDRLTYDPLTFDEVVAFAFDEQATVFQEGDKRCFAKGFALPTSGGSYSISVTSYKTGTVQDPAIMYPKIELLDKDYKTLRVLPNSAFVLRTSSSGEGLNTVFFENNVEEGDRFLLITNRRTDDADLISSQANIRSIVPFVVPFGGGWVGMWMIQTDRNSPPLKMKASPTGQLEVACRKYHPKKVGE